MKTFYDALMYVIGTLIVMGMLLIPMFFVVGAMAGLFYFSFN